MAEEAEKVSANKLFNKFKSKTGTKRTFKDFLDKIKDSGALEKAIDLAYQGEKDKPSVEDIAPAKEEPKKEVKILGMEPWMAYTAGGVLLIGIGFGLFKMFKKD